MVDFSAQIPTIAAIEVCEEYMNIHTGREVVSNETIILSRRFDIGFQKVSVSKRHIFLEARVGNVLIAISVREFVTIPRAL